MMTYIMATWLQCYRWSLKSPLQQSILSEDCGSNSILQLIVWLPWAIGWKESDSPVPRLDACWHLPIQLQIWICILCPGTAYLDKGLQFSAGPRITWHEIIIYHWPHCTVYTPSQHARVGSTIYLKNLKKAWGCRTKKREWRTKQRGWRNNSTTVGAP